MYIHARITIKQWLAELLSLLDDEPFQVVMQNGLDSASEYNAMTECLKAQYNPDCNELEWQAKFQHRVQNPNERLFIIVRTLLVLADKVYSSWSGGQHKEWVRDHFIPCGMCSSSIQLKLMQDKPRSLEETVKLARQQDGVEEAQRKLQYGRKAEDLCTNAEGMVGISGEVRVLSRQW